MLMNFAKPRQVDESADRADAGKWRWTVYNDNTKRVYASGYCGDCPGHETADEAAAHHHEYQLDHMMLSETDSQHHCAKCGDWTALWAGVRLGGSYPLCAIHRTREIVAELTGLPGEEWYT